MKQGNLFDDLYEEQQTEVEHHISGHMNCDKLYSKAEEGVIKQRLVTYAKDAKGNVKRTEKIRNFQAKEFHDITTVEVFL
ncbi:hypothetical protein N9H30_00305 [bacterium]|nr:hypothetical protein [bacterium]|tara:strand:+ start:3224 stop:3463 length:240 start_codon:yes stop_codon:yes gene_type:complete